MNLLPADQAHYPTPTNSGGATSKKDVTIVGKTIPGSVVLEDSSKGYYKWDGGAVATDADGLFSVNERSTQGINNFNFLVIDPWGRKVIRPYPVFWLPFAAPGSVTLRSNSPSPGVPGWPATRAGCDQEQRRMVRPVQVTTSAAFLKRMGLTTELFRHDSRPNQPVSSASSRHRSLLFHIRSPRQLAIVGWPAQGGARPNGCLFVPSPHSTGVGKVGRLRPKRKSPQTDVLTVGQYPPRPVATSPGLSRP